MTKEIKDSHDEKKAKKAGKRKIIIISMLVLACAFFAVGLGIIGYVISTTPEIDPGNIYSLLAQTSEIYDDQGNIIQNIDSNEYRINVPIEEIPKNLVNAVISIEDKTFYEHHGFNYIRLMGAVVDSITKKERIGGTSTITQQLARNLYLTNERSLIRKLREAYYTIKLEKELTKDQIMEAYLNTIYLGFNSYGVEAAAQSYFSKDVEDLTLEECATIASIPKNPSGYAPLKRGYSTDIKSDNPNIVLRSNIYTIIYNDFFVERQRQILGLMLEQRKITQDEYKLASAVEMKTAMKPAQAVNVDIYSYFSDYMINQVKKDLIETLNIDETSASKMLQSGGLRIYSTLNVAMQKTAAEEFEKNTNFPRVTGLDKDRSGNILDSEGRIILYNISNYFDANGNFLLHPSEYLIDEVGNITIFGGKRLNFYKTESARGTGCIIEFENFYRVENGTFYVINGGNIIINSKYIEKKDSGDIVINNSFLQENPDFFKYNENGIYIDSSQYSLRQEVVQPQGAMVITNWDTGEIKAMIGGRNLAGRRLYNRAVNPRQPGSSIKPIAVYGPALETWDDDNSRWTAGSYLEDSEYYVEGKLWPKNWYYGYRGFVTLRRCVEQSINVTAVKLLESIGINKSITFLEGLGITSIQRDDYNLAALGLGGMTKGISPLEMTSAYGAFPNGGLYIAPYAYTKVLDAGGNVILEKTGKTYQAMDEGVAFIMTDILRTTVSRGIARAATISSQPVGGKTGTTTDNYDSWFVGFTPKYSAALWIGNDINVELSEGSSAAAKLWSKVMEKICDGMPRGTYEMPGNVEEKYGEFYILGTYKTRKQPTKPEEIKVTDAAIDLETTGSSITILETTGSSINSEEVQ